MSNYYLVKKQSLTGFHTVHKEFCPFLQNPEKNIALGNFDSSNDAIWKAKMIFGNSCACPFCSKESKSLSTLSFYEWNMFSTS